MLKWRVGIGEQFRQEFAVAIGDRMADNALASHTPKMAIAAEAARIAILPEGQQGFTGQRFHFPRHDEMLAVATAAARPDAQAAGLEIGSPKTQAIGPAGTRHKPPCQQHEVGAAAGPIQTGAQAHGMQVDEEQPGLVVGRQLHQNVGRVQIVVANACIMEPGHELAQRFRQSMPNDSLPWGWHRHQRGGQKGVERLCVVESCA